MPKTLLRGHALHWVKVPYSGSMNLRPHRVVLAHGLLIGNLAAWYLSCAHQLSAWAEVLMYDLRGHGHSAHSLEGFRLTELAEDLEALLMYQGWDEGPLVMAGHSYGGRVLLTWAESRSERLAQLTLVDSPLTRSELPDIGLPELKASPEDLEELDELIERLPAPLQLALQGGGRRARRALESWWRLIAESSLMADLKVEPEPSDELLTRLSPRLRAIYGANSPCLGSMKRLRQRCEPAQLHLVAEAGHYLLNEAPTRVCELLCEGLAALSQER
jgi:pimeloyl-ACP methyl ester carboxylesterase